jgi:hypothetical protein
VEIFAENTTRPLTERSEVGERGRLPRDGRGDGKACRYQQGHRENRRATCSEAFQRLGDGALRSGFRIILAETAERKTESFLFRRRRRNNPKKREVKGFEGWRFPQGNTTPYLYFSLAWYALPIERLFVPEVALRVGACGA